MKPRGRRAAASAVNSTCRRGAIRRVASTQFQAEADDIRWVRWAQLARGVAPATLSANVQDVASLFTDVSDEAIPATCYSQTKLLRGEVKDLLQLPAPEVAAARPDMKHLDVRQLVAMRARCGVVPPPQAVEWCVKTWWLAG